MFICLESASQIVKTSIPPFLLDEPPQILGRPYGNCCPERAALRQAPTSVMHRPKLGLLAKFHRVSCWLIILELGFSKFHMDWYGLICFWCFWPNWCGLAQCQGWFNTPIVVKFTNFTSKPEGAVACERVHIWDGASNFSQFEWEKSWSNRIKHEALAFFPVVFRQIQLWWL